MTIIICNLGFLHSNLARISRPVTLFPCQVAGRWMAALEDETEWFPICDTLDSLSTTALCKIAFDMDVPFKYNGDEAAVYNMVTTCFSGIKDKLFNPLGCTVRWVSPLLDTLADLIQ